MCNFVVLGSRLWEYRASGAEINRTVYTWHNGILQVLGENADGDLALHLIDEAGFEDILQLLPESTGHTVYMDVSSPFALLPKEFRLTDVNTADPEPRLIRLDETLYLSFPGDQNAVHAALPMYFIGKQAAGRSGQYLICLVLNGYCMLLYFKNGVCELANIYPAVSESEVLYYCLAVAKKTGQDIRQIRFEIFGNNAADILNAFHRFIPNVSLHRIQLPYSTGEYPPQAEVSYLLHQFLKCALPEEV